MELLLKVRDIWEHVFWADARLFEAIRDSEGAADPLHEYLHILGAEEVWLSRLERRSPRAAVWPEASRDGAKALREQVERGYRAYLSGLRPADLSAPTTYTNSAGTQFTSSVGDILLHVALHGQYHRGKVNLLLRQAGHAPAATDYIAFVRGTPAATARRAAGGA